MIDRQELIRAFDGMDLAVRTEAWAKKYRGKPALSGLDLHLPEGSVYVLAGPNGAGKTTTLRMLLGLIQPDQGSGRVFGLDPWRQSASVRATIGYVPEFHQSPQNTTAVGRLLAHQAAYRPTWDDKYAEFLIRELKVRLEPTYGELSKGEARRVQLVAAMAHRPPLLLLDEPTDGLDPVLRDRFQALLADHLSADKSGRTTVLISTHLIQETELLADHLGVLSGGRLRAQLSTADLAARLRRYRFEADEDFGANGLTVLQRRQAGSEREWVVWGEEEVVLAALQGGGARTCQVRPLGLAEAVRILIDLEEDPS